MTREQYRAFPETLTVREVKGGKRVLVTTIADPREAKKNDLLALYVQRWHVGVSGEGHNTQSVKVRPRRKDSSLVAWEAPWRESKAVKPSDQVLIWSAATH